MSDELRDSIVDPVDLVLYDEARHCLEVGADRAAFIMSWIAAAEGMLGKLRTMGALHSALGTFVRSFEAAQKAGTAKDAELIEKSNEIGLINRVERIELDAMRDLRNQYGHPTAASPDHESAENALRVAVRYVLAKPALLMQGAAKGLAARASTDHHYLPSDEAAIRGFVTARAALIHPDARPLFIQELLAGAERQLQDVNGELLAQRCLSMASIALEEWSEALDPPRWGIDKMQQVVPTSAADVFSRPAIWQRLLTEDQDRILSRCLDEPTGALFARDPGRLLARADYLSTAGLLTGPQQTRVLAAIDAADPWRLLRSGTRFAPVARAIIRKLDHGSFNVAGEGVELLRSSEDTALRTLDENTQYEIGLKLAYAANQNTFAAVNEVTEMSAHPDRWPVALLKGVVVGGLAGKFAPIRHLPTAKATLRLALADNEGTFALAALDALTPERTEGMAFPSIIGELRAIIEGASASPASAALTSFLDKLEPDLTISGSPMINFDAPTTPD